MNIIIKSTFYFIISDYMKHIYVIDIETSGTVGYPTDKIYEIAVAKCNIQTENIDIVYNEIIHHYVKDLSERQKEAWIFSNSTLNLEDITNALKNPNKISNELKILLNEKFITSYNLEFDYFKFLKHSPFNLSNVNLLSCIMQKATKICQIRNKYGFKYPSLEEAIKKILPTDIKILVDQFTNHRAENDAITASYVLLELIKLKKFPLPELFHI